MTTDDSESTAALRQISLLRTAGHDEFSLYCITDLKPESIKIAQNVMVEGLGGSARQVRHGCERTAIANHAIATMELSPGLFDEHDPNLAHLARVGETRQQCF